ncbi:hypothetical protein [Phragmitibacter flavus]|uniref:hypothetical protein n=1 Tax=Phragmitibacter flavus TaxID=2576071 RepID=UPI0019816BFC|nr:hypothetical protein [Phragmitibacter flavus]
MTHTFSLRNEFSKQSWEAAIIGMILGLMAFYGNDQIFEMHGMGNDVADGDGWCSGAGAGETEVEEGAAGFAGVGGVV